MYGVIGGAAGAAGGAALAATGGTALGWTIFGMMSFIIMGITVLRLATRSKRRSG
jgi:hypothetical protein